MTEQPRTGLVLAGGGPRGAYEVGVLAGLTEALGLTRSDMAPFDIYAGTSVGAINAAFLASQSARGDLATGRLADLWSSLEITTYLQLRSWIDWVATPRATAKSERLGISLLDPVPLERLVRNSISWKALQQNVASGRVDALFIAALQLETGVTTVFTQTHAQTTFTPSRDPRRVSVRAEIAAEHVLASAAVPLMFPARRIGNSYYCDGGLRFNTPIAPTIRAGASRLVVISTAGRSAPIVSVRTQYPSLPFLAGKLLDALLLDPVDYDLQILNRINRLIDMHQRVLTPEAAAELDRLYIEIRGVPYRRVTVLTFHPSQDIGTMAAKHLKRHLPKWGLSRAMRMVLNRAARVQTEADWASYILFDGSFAQQLIELGHRDARTQAAEIRRFFDA